MKASKLDLAKLIPVSRPDNHTIVCHLPGVVAGSTQRTVVTLKRSMEHFEVVLDILVTLGSALNERTVRVHRQQMSLDDVKGWCALEQSLVHNQSTTAERDRAAALALLVNCGVFPKLETK